MSDEKTPVYPTGWPHVKPDGTTELGNSVRNTGDPAKSPRLYVPQAPGMVVRDQNGNGYCAAMIHTCHQDGRWGLAFLCSGGLMFLPWDQVQGIEYYSALPHGRQHCDVCDGPLTAWPHLELAAGSVQVFQRDPETGGMVRLDPAQACSEDRDDGQPLRTP